MYELRLCVVDDNYRGLNSSDMALSRVWAAAAKTSSYFHVVLPAKNWREATDSISRVVDRESPRSVCIAVWGHGRKADPLIGDTKFKPHELASVVRGAMGYIWFRSCDVFQGVEGQEFAVDVADITSLTVYGHTRVISKGPPPFGLLNAAYQSGGYGLRPDESPHWDPDDRGFSSRRAPNTVTVFQHHPPFSWLQPLS